MSHPRKSELYNFLRSQIAERTKQAETAVRDDSVLIELGLQSIDAVLMCGEVEDHFGIEMDPAAVFEHKTLESFAQFVLQKMAA